MTRTLATAAAVLVLGLGTAAFADDAKQCSDGITFLKAEAAKNPPKATLDKIKKALKGAERELGEKEYDECIDYVNDGKKAVSG
ncbi:histidine kinase [Ancylobacter lacus]|uniref:histidine kinase n=1 Tax=Ancylobacter lacus TaxID=2579970 RepID=UPI001BCBA4C2|nr:histidine kinase [Ancylobacter lacus]MBS7539465.1 histidine kinase [Ancylobacter lacus]